jgi:hypothetical protein
MNISGNPEVSRSGLGAAAANALKNKRRAPMPRENNPIENFAHQSQAGAKISSHGAGLLLKSHQGALGSVIAEGLKAKLNSNSLELLR